MCFHFFGILLDINLILVLYMDRIPVWAALLAGIIAGLIAAILAWLLLVPHGSKKRNDNNLNNRPNFTMGSHGIYFPFNLLCWYFFLSRDQSAAFFFQLLRQIFSYFLFYYSFLLFVIYVCIIYVGMNNLKVVLWVGVVFGWFSGLF